MKPVDVYRPGAEDNSPRGKHVKMGGYQMLSADSPHSGNL